ncbi:MAG: hypothetical protein CSA52_03875 [Gammaproteobacteria bacterium]|nr:MAG: hypothetical protein CSB48_10600 [Pseudomonadota bacterium]PIE38016.1 MAG: hypothetical protein CSA52_03875 [Gammaproteobacteria bacterium]
MKQKSKPIYSLISTLGLSILLSACATTQHEKMDSVDEKLAQLNAQEQKLKQQKESLSLQKRQLSEKENELKKQIDMARQAQAKAAKPARANMQSDINAPLLPGNAKAGECYARVFVPPAYKTTTETVLKNAESYKLDIIPATYKMVDKRIMVSDASQKLITVPAKYKTVTEKVLVRDKELVWRTSLDRNSAKASPILLDTAKKYGINLDAARPGDCFHEHYLPPRYETVYTNELVSEESFRIDVVPPTYKTVTEKVLVKEASTRLVNVPATYKYSEEKILVREAYTDWKKGRGPIERIDNSTGEIMCLVEIPAEYKIVRKKVVDKPAHTVVKNVPAEYKTVTVRKMITPASERKVAIPAKYNKVGQKKLVEDGQILWHDIHDKSLDSNTRTGNQICLTETPAKYRRVSKKVVVTPAKTVVQDVPAVYKTVKVKTLATKARERKVVIPAEYQKITRKTKISDGHLEWRSVLCETNTTSGLISKLQSALAAKHYRPGPVDGLYGAKTASAVKQYQMDKGLATGGLTMETLKSLGL